MRNKTAAILIAAALVSGNVMTGVAGNFKVVGNDPTPPGGLKVQPQQHQVQPAQGGIDGFQAPTFKAKCDTGFGKIAEHKTNIAGVPVVDSYECRTQWIQCPNMPAFQTTNMEIEIQQQGGEGLNKKYRVWYKCWGYNPQG